MPKKRRKPRRPPRPRHRTARAPAPPPGPPPDEPDLLTDVADMLDEPHPWRLLGFASSLLEAVGPQRGDPFGASDADPEAPSLEQLADSFVDVDLRETTALLAVLAELVPDQVLARRLRREVARRRHPLPKWLTDLAPLRIEGAAETTHVLGDGDNVMIEARTRAGDALTAIVYIDHNLGTVAKDAFVVPSALDELRADFLDAADHDPDVRAADLDPADARARIDEAVALWAISFPPLESETWPACRPLLTWMVGHLPEDGRGYERPEWSDKDRVALAAQFMASPYGQGHDAEDREMVDTLLSFGCDYGPGDPLRWSPVAVEILLGDWLPRKVVADVAFLTRAPTVLRSFIRFSHEQRRIRSSLTDETLAAVDANEPDYQHAIRSPRAQGPAALLAAMGLGPDADDSLLGSLDTGELLLESLARDVGGPEVLADLDVTPLPDEPFDWSVVPDDVGDAVAEVLDQLDRCCGQLLDAEVRTACRRLLADVVAGDAEVFRRRGRTDTAAAAIAWAVAKANGWLRPDRLTAKELLACFGVSGSVSQRAGTLARAAGIHEFGAYNLRLGSPRYLVSAHRQQVIETRDRWQADRA